MQHSLSVILPVCNSQSTLDATIREILDVLPELTRYFELVIVDDSSSDATIEVADEFVSRYPQIRAIRHVRPKGFHKSIQTGLAQSRGEIICVRDENSQLTLDEVLRQWSRMHQMLSTPASVRSDSMNPKPNPFRGGIWMTTRQMAGEIEVLREAISMRTELSDGRPKRPNYLKRVRDFALGE